MGSNYKDVNEARQKLEPEINAALAERGVWTASTCPTGELHGWDMNLHYALEWFQRHTRRTTISLTSFLLTCILARAPNIASWVA